MNKLRLAAVVDYPFNDEAHLANFEEGRALAQRGGHLAPVCGARTRSGGRCRHAPLVGGSRCLRHAGPKAARQYRERRYEAMRSGKISYAEFARGEAKRAANRLRDQWKKDPWVPGGTIDLGEHEMAFQGELHHWLGDRQLAPAVIDWLRWKFRRMQIDGSRDEDWARLLRDELPRRLLNAGVPPPGWLDRQGAGTWSMDGPAPSAKRRLPDRVGRASAAQVNLPVVTNPMELDPTEFAEIVRRAGPTLVALLAQCADDDERHRLLAALVSYASSPGSQAARERWTQVVTALRAR